MTKLREIEQAISSLPPKDLAQFRTWFEDFDAALWDKQFEEDTKTGKIDALAQKAVADFKEGRFKEL
jgi:hypothetical protein